MTKSIIGPAQRLDSLARGPAQVTQATAHGRGRRRLHSCSAFDRTVAQAGDCPGCLWPRAMAVPRRAVHQPPGVRQARPVPGGDAVSLARRSSAWCFAGVTVSVLVLGGINELFSTEALPWETFAIYWAVALVYVGGSRLLVRHVLYARKPGAARVVIYGAGNRGRAGRERAAQRRPLRAGGVSRR